MKTIAVRTGTRAMPAARSVPRAPAAAGDARLAPGTAAAVVAAWASGLIVAALGAAGVTGDTPALGAYGGALVAVGAVALGWGALSLSRARMVAPRTATVVALLLPVALGFAVAADPARLSGIGAAAASAFAVIVGVLGAIAARAASSSKTADAAPRGGMLTLIVAAAFAGAVVAPALSAVQAAQLHPGQVVQMDREMDMGGHGH